MAFHSPAANQIIVGGMKASSLRRVAALAAAFLCGNAPPAHAQIFSCEVGARDVAMKVLKATSSSFDADLTAANAAIASAARLKADTLAGRDVPAPYGVASRYAKPALEATSPEVTELLRRAVSDQLLRFQPDIAFNHTLWAAGLSEPALGYAFRIVALDGCGADEANTAWLKARLKAHGWFAIPDYGNEADSAAFLIVQHADHDPTFQAEVLLQLEKLALEGKTRPPNFAMLYDRVAIGERRPQRYGSQGGCATSGWTPFEIEDPANLDQRRVAMGLKPLADDVAGKTARYCTVR
jgi:hypothetical protein